MDNTHHRKKAYEPEGVAWESGRVTSNQESADQLLEHLGYKAELCRNRSTLQVAFMSFVLASIPYGLATTLYYPLIGGGPVNIIWGWVAVSLIIICVAASLGEITSVYPTAGGVYYQAFMLSPPALAPHCQLDLRLALRRWQHYHYPGRQLWYHPLPRRLHQRL
jgi:amino acid permease